MFIKRYNADLANDYGNVINRITILIEKNFDGLCPKPGRYNKDELEIITFYKSILLKVATNMEELKIHDTLETIFSLIREINKYLEIKQPWKLIKINKAEESEAATSLYVAAELLRISSELLLPFMPEKAQITLNNLSAEHYKNKLDFGKLVPNTKISNPGVLFPRIEE